jgi:hypothetical protein
LTASRTEDDLGGLGSELPPRFGRARLHDDGPALDRAGDVEWFSDAQVLTFVVEHMHPVGIEEQTALLVAQPCIICEAIPEAGDHFVEFERSPVAFVVLDVTIQPKVQCGVRVRRSRYSTLLGRC